MPSLTVYSGNTSICCIHLVSIDIFPQSIQSELVENKQKVLTPEQGHACFDVSGLELQLLSRDVFQCIFRCLPVLRYTWQMYTLEFPVKCYILFIW